MKSKSVEILDWKLTPYNPATDLVASVGIGDLVLNEIRARKDKNGRYAFSLPSTRAVSGNSYGSIPAIWFKTPELKAEYFAAIRSALEVALGEAR